MGASIWAAAFTQGGAQKLIGLEVAGGGELKRMGEDTWEP